MWVLLMHTAHISEKTKQVVTIKKGSSLTQITDKLTKKGVLKYPFLFKVYVKVKGIGPELRSGSFLLDPKASIHQLALSVTGKIPSQHMIKLTIPEGFSLKKIGKRLEKTGLMSEESFKEYIEEDAFKLRKRYPFLIGNTNRLLDCLLYTSPSPRDRTRSRMPSSA